MGVLLALAEMFGFTDPAAGRYSLDLVAREAKTSIFEKRREENCRWTMIAGWRLPGDQPARRGSFIKFCSGFLDKLPTPRNRRMELRHRHHRPRAVRKFRPIEVFTCELFLSLLVPPTP